MDNWKLMYAVVWVSFFQIVFIFFSPLGLVVNVAVHVVGGVAVLFLAFTIHERVLQTSCPDRIKRITRATQNLAALQGLLGIALGFGVAGSWGSLYFSVLGVLHVGNALAIITQTSSSATAYDMWEEKEFQVPPAVP